MTQSETDNKYYRSHAWLLMLDKLIDLLQKEKEKA